MGQPNKDLTFVYMGQPNKDLTFVYMGQPNKDLTFVYMGQPNKETLLTLVNLTKILPLFTWVSLTSCPVCILTTQRSLLCTKASRSELVGQILGSILAPGTVVAMLEGNNCSSLCGGIVDRYNSQALNLSI